MATQAQLEANRQNALKSTGPRTDEGKAQSSKNALTHGLTAAAQSLLPTECSNSYNMFLDEMRQSLHPGSPLENVLVRRIADTLWRLQRVPDAEAQLFLALGEKARAKVQKENDEEQEAYESELRWKKTDVDPPALQPLPDDPAAAQALAQAFLKKDSQNPFLRLQRYEQSLNHTLNRSMYELRQLQLDRQKNPRDDQGQLLQQKVQDLQAKVAVLVDRGIDLQGRLANLQRAQAAAVQIEPNLPATPDQPTPSKPAPPDNLAPTPHAPHPLPLIPNPQTLDPHPTDNGLLTTDEESTDHGPLTTDQPTTTGRQPLP